METYEQLLKRLLAGRNNKTLSEDAEDALLEEMDLVWDNLTDAERMNQIPSVWVETEKCKECGGLLVLVENDEVCCSNCDRERVEKFYAPIKD